LFNAAITVDGSDVLLTNIVVRDVVDLGIALYGARAVTNNVSVNGVRAMNGFLGGAGLFITAGSLRNGPIVIQNTDGIGLLANNGSALDVSSLTVTDIGLQSSGFPVGVYIQDGAVGNFGQLTVQRNKSGAGILIQVATFSSYGAMIVSENTGAGIFVTGGSRFSNPPNTTVTNNQFGLYATDVSLAVLRGGTFTGNGLDISCDGPPPATVLLAGPVVYGSTDCTFPASASAKVPKGLTVPTPPVFPPR
jgi:hypothetical protein